MSSSKNPISKFFNFSEGEISKGQDVKDLQLGRENGEPLTVKDFSGKWLVVYFYPKDNTPGCTKEAQTFSEMMADFREQEAEVIGVSADTEASHQQFKEKHDLKVRLLSDPDGELARKFGIRIMFGMCSRDTILINPDSQVDAIHKGVSPKGSPGKLLTYIKNQNLIRSTKTT